MEVNQLTFYSGQGVMMYRASIIFLHQTQSAKKKKLAHKSPRLGLSLRQECDSDVALIGNLLNDFLGNKTFCTPVDPVLKKFDV